MKAMILAAGRGERMGHLTADRPKPLLAVGAETLLDRHLRALSKAGIGDIVVNLSYRGDQIRQSLGDTSRWGQRIVYSDEGDSPLETAGGIVQALPLLGPEPFLVISADVITELDLSTLHKGTAEGCLMLVANPAHNLPGDFGVTDSGVLTVEPPLLTYGGIAVLDPELFDGLVPGSRPLRPVFESAIERGALRGMVFAGLWRDVGTPERLREAREAVQQRE